MLAEIGRNRPSGAIRQQPVAEQHDDGDRAEHQRHARDGELEIAERRQPSIRRRLGDQHVHRRSGERKQGSGMRPEHQRHEELRGRTAEPDCHDDNDGQQRGDRPVDADERPQARDEQHRENQQSRAARPRLCDQELARPCRHARGVEPLTDHEQRRDEDDRGVAETRQRILQIENAGRVERQRRPERDDHHRNTVPHEENHDGGDDREGDGYVAQGACPSLYPATQFRERNRRSQRAAAVR